MKCPCAGFSLVELMVSLTIGALVIIGALTINDRCRATYTVNETLARLHENALYALSTIEADVRMAGYWGLTNDARFLTGVVGNAPLTLSGSSAKCGAGFPIDLGRAVGGENGAYSLPCSPGPSGSSAQAGSDTLFVRRVDVKAVSATDDRLQVYTTRGGAGSVFHSNTAPGPIAVDPLTGPTAEIHDLIVRAYYVSHHSSHKIGIPSLRRKNLQGGPSSGPEIEDQEIMPGVEDLQVQFGLDPGIDDDGDGTPDRYPGITTRYVNPDEPDLATARVTAVKVWIRVRAEAPEPGYTDNANYNYADLAGFQPTDGYARLVVWRTFAVIAFSGPRPEPI